MSTSSTAEPTLAPSTTTNTATSVSVTSSTPTTAAVTPSPSPFPSHSHSPAISMLHDIIAGTVGGCCSVVVGQPFDTVKVRLQTSPHLYPSLLSCVRTTTQQGALFRGMTAPLIGSIPLNALAFGSNGWANRHLDHFMPDKERQMQQRLFLSGLWAGTTQSIFACPIDVIKCNMQIAAQGKGTTATTTTTTQTSTSATSSTSTSSTLKTRRIRYPTEPVPSTYTPPRPSHPHSLPHPHPQSMFASSSSSSSGTKPPLTRTYATTPSTASASASSSPSAIQFIRHTIATQGIRGLYRGWHLTAARDSLSYAVYFTGYEYVKDLIAPDSNSDMYATNIDDTEAKHASTGAMLMAGGIAGVAAWTVVYPIDVIKSIVQTSSPRLLASSASSSLLSSSSSSSLSPAVSHSTMSLVRTRFARDGWSMFTHGLAPTLIRAFPVNGVLLLVFETSLRWMNSR